MWESDKALLRAYQECYRNLLTEMREGGDVDLSSACLQETKALTKVTDKAIKFYKEATRQQDGCQRKNDRQASC